jgi:hypothetical protein
MQTIKADLMNGTPPIDIIVQDDDVEDFLDFMFEATASITAITKMYEDAV